MVQTPSSADVTQTEYKDRKQHLSGTVTQKLRFFSFCRNPPQFEVCYPRGLVAL